MPAGPIYTVHVTKDGDYFVLTIDDVGVTQARHPDEIELMARDYIASILEVGEGTFGLNIVAGAF